MEIKQGDKFRLNSRNGQTYVFYILNVNTCRPPEMRYCSEAYNVTEGGICASEYFCDADFFGLCTKISNAEYQELRYKKKQAHIA